MFLLQPTPFVVDVIKQPPPTPDISVSVVISVLLMPFVALGVLVLAGLCVAGTVVLYKRWREGTPATPSDERIRLKISS